MALWERLGSRGTVVDRRGMRLGGVGGISLSGLALLFAIHYLTGGSIGDVLAQLPAMQGTATETQYSTEYDGRDAYEEFVATVLGSANNALRNQFALIGAEYREPQLVLFRDATQSACGYADARVGPHYCPRDETIYLDETFFAELQSRFGARGGDVAEAYVIAHEVGHHAQHLLGGLESETQNEAIATELQADCFAGVWAYSLKDSGVFEEGEIMEAMDAASAVGDDRIQERTEGRVRPENWTHGSSAERQSAFSKGYAEGTLASCTS